MSKPAPHRLMANVYPITMVCSTRYQDLDTNGHLNNVAIAALFENGRVSLNRTARPVQDRPQNERTMVAAITITYLREGHYPDDVTVCSGIGRIGTSSWTIEQAMFQNGQCIGTCDTVVVCRTDNLAKSLRAELEAELASMMVGSANPA